MQCSKSARSTICHHHETTTPRLTGTTIQFTFIYEEERMRRKEQSARESEQIYSKIPTWFPPRLLSNRQHICLLYFTLYRERKLERKSLLSLKCLNLTRRLSSNSDEERRVTIFNSTVDSTISVFCIFSSLQ